jgi:DNA polymerase III sliding clamp (beta) subunit (PCNA family)
MNTSQIKSIAAHFKKSTELEVKKLSSGAYRIADHNTIVQFEPLNEADDWAIPETIGDNAYIEHHTGFGDLNNKVAELDIKELKYVVKAAPTNDARYYLNGVAVYNDGIAATDGYRLHFTENLTRKDNEPPLILPTQTIKLLLKLQKTGTVSLYTSEDKTRYWLNFHGGFIAGQLIEGRFPDIFRVIPDTSKYEAVTVGSHTAAELNTVVAICKADSPRHPTLKFNCSATTLKGRSLPFSVGQVEHLCGFNSEYLKDALPTKKEAIIKIGGSYVSALIEFDNFRAVIMSVRL